MGIAHDHNGGARFRNPVTKLTITRHSFKFVDTVDPVSPTYLIDPSVSSLINCPLPPPSVPPTPIVNKKGPKRTSRQKVPVVEPEPINSRVSEPTASPSSTKEIGPTACEQPHKNTANRKVPSAAPIAQEEGPIVQQRKVTFSDPIAREGGPIVQISLPTLPKQATRTDNGKLSVPTTRTSSRSKKPIDRFIPDAQPTETRNPPSRSFPISKNCHLCWYTLERLEHRFQHPKTRRLFCRTYCRRHPMNLAGLILHWTIR